MCLRGAGRLEEAVVGCGHFAPAAPVQRQPDVKLLGGHSGGQIRLDCGIDVVGVGGNSGGVYNGALKLVVLSDAP